jgi:hypothetical protein
MTVPVGVAGLDLLGLFGLRKMPQRRSEARAVHLDQASNKRSFSFCTSTKQSFVKPFDSPGGTP